MDPFAPPVRRSRVEAPASSLTRRHHIGTGAVLVLVGGATGTAARYAIERVVPTHDGWPWGTLTANLTGAFLLGLLLEHLAQAGTESRVGRRVRLCLGTGVLGGYTTFSSLAVETVVLAGHQRFLAMSYLMLSLLAGLGAVAAGVSLAAGRRRLREDSEPVDPDVDEVSGRTDGGAR